MHTKKKGSIEELAVIGIVIGKETCRLVGSDRSGQLVMRKQIKRLTLCATFDQLPLSCCRFRGHEEKIVT